MPFQYCLTEFPIRNISLCTSKTHIIDFCYPLATLLPCWPYYQCCESLEKLKRKKSGLIHSDLSWSCYQQIFKTTYMKSSFLLSESCAYKCYWEVSWKNSLKCHKTNKVVSHDCIQCATKNWSKDFFESLKTMLEPCLIVWPGCKLKP